MPSLHPRQCRSVCWVWTNNFKWNGETRVEFSEAVDYWETWRTVNKFYTIVVEYIVVLHLGSQHHLWCFFHLFYSLKALDLRYNKWLPIKQIRDSSVHKEFSENNGVSESLRKCAEKFYLKFWFFQKLLASGSWRFYFVNLILAQWRVVVVIWTWLCLLLIRASVSDAARGAGERMTPSGECQIFKQGIR